MKHIVMAAAATMLLISGANALTIPSGSVITSDGAVVPFHETENAQRQVEDQGYAILGNNVALVGVDVTLTIEEAVDLIKNGLVDADLPPAVLEELQSLDDEDFANAVEALNEGLVSVDDINSCLTGGSCEAVNNVDLGPDNG